MKSNYLTNNLNKYNNSSERYKINSYNSYKQREEKNINDFQNHYIKLYIEKLYSYLSL